LVRVNLVDTEPEPIQELREQAANTGPPPPALAAYLEKVTNRAYSITDADVAELKAAGLDEDVIFEQTVGVAISEGLRRLDVAMRVIG
jgi:alkylhydroperoxidase family enzyme